MLATAYYSLGACYSHGNPKKTGRLENGSGDIHSPAACYSLAACCRVRCMPLPYASSSLLWCCTYWRGIEVCACMDLGRERGREELYTVESMACGRRGRGTAQG